MISLFLIIDSVNLQSNFEPYTPKIISNENPLATSIYNSGRGYEVLFLYIFSILNILLNFESCGNIILSIV